MVTAFSEQKRATDDAIPRQIGSPPEKVGRD
jgi:hypothetical protein